MKLEPTYLNEHVSDMKELADDSGGVYEAVKVILGEKGDHYLACVLAAMKLRHELHTGVEVPVLVASSEMLATYRGEPH